MVAFPARLSLGYILREPGTLESRAIEQTPVLGELPCSGANELGLEGKKKWKYKDYILGLVTI